MKRDQRGICAVAASFLALAAFAESADSGTETSRFPIDLDAMDQEVIDSFKSWDTSLDGVVDLEEFKAAVNSRRDFDRAFAGTRRDNRGAARADKIQGEISVLREAIRDGTATEGDQQRLIDHIEKQRERRSAITREGSKEVHLELRKRVGERLEKTEGVSEHGKDRMTQGIELRFNSMDKDGSGMIEEDELQKPSDRYRPADTNGDGLLSREEAVEMRRQAGAGR